MKRFLLILLVALLLASLLSLTVFADESGEEMSEASEISQAEETIGGISKTAWMVISVLVVLLIGYAAYSVKFKNKR